MVLAGEYPLELVDSQGNVNFRKVENREVYCKTSCNNGIFTIEYSTDGGKKWSTTVPSLTSAGKLKVKVRATGGGHVLTHEDVTLQVIEGIPAGTKLTIVAHGSQNKAPIRDKASNSGEKLATIDAGETCTLIKQQGSWYKVEYGDVVGYVYNWFVKVGTITVED